MRPSSNFRLAVVSVAVVIGVAVALVPDGLGPKPKPEHPQKEFSIDGCDLYSFEVGRDTEYFARCPNTKTATTYDGGKHIITEVK